MLAAGLAATGRHARRPNMGAWPHHDVATRAGGRRSNSLVSPGWIRSQKSLRSHAGDLARAFFRFLASPADEGLFTSDDGARRRPGRAQAAVQPAGARLRGAMRRAGRRSRPGGRGERGVEHARGGGLLLRGPRGHARQGPRRLALDADDGVEQAVWVAGAGPGLARTRGALRGRRRHPWSVRGPRVRGPAARLVLHRRR
jgi:hypothetical protein